MAFYLIDSIDEALNDLKEMDSPKNAREKAIVKTKLEEARMWAEKIYS